ncbi:VIT and VWA domain-containing protein [bacterium]|nr:VIT and VWA domain-containing protein [bacterium]
MLFNRNFYKLIFAAVLLLSASGNAVADGVIVPLPSPYPMPRMNDFYSVKYHRVSVDVQDQIATTTVEQSFINETNRNIEVEYLFPLPRGSSVNQFSLIVDDQELEGRILDKDEARRIYEEIVRRQKDPALLEYIGNGMFRTSVFPLPANGERTVKLTYTELLQPDGSQFEYRYPLNTEKFSKKVLEEVRIDFRLNSQHEFKNVYSPSHDFTWNWSGSKKVVGHWSDEGVRPADDCRIFWSRSEDDIGGTLFTYRPDRNEDGYFLFLASPKVELKAKKAIPKNVILVLDISGSMQGEKINQARSAAKFITRNINPDDNYNIIFYNSTVDPLWDNLKPFDKSVKREALDRLDQVEAKGSTDIHAALTTALKQIKDAERPNYIIFLTDGLPTAGITEIGKIAEEVKAANKHNTRLFAFGVGFDVNAILLDRLGVDNHGLADYVPPDEDIEAKVASLYSKIQNPALTAPELIAKDIRLRDAYPQDLPDIFHGSQLVLAGRYRDTGKSTLTLTGRSQSEKMTFKYPVEFAKKTGREEFSFVARIWAERKIGYLNEQIRIHGVSDEYIDEIVELSTRYGIITQYTSFLAEENFDIADRMEVRDQVEVLYNKPLVATGSAGVSQSMQSQEMKKRQSAPGKAQYYDETGTMKQVDTVKLIGSKTFYLKKNGWMDAEYKEGMKTKEIKQFSDEFFELANKYPTQAQFLTFAYDKAILTVIDGVAYQLQPAE